MKTIIKKLEAKGFFCLAEEVRDLIPGGRADGRPDSDFDLEQLKMGIKVEMEHTNDPELAKEIAKDHLDEIPDYYTRLLEMEKEAENEGEGEIEGETSDVEDTLIEFFNDNPNPEDSDIHELADSLNMSPHDLETHIYSLLTKYLPKKDNVESIVKTLALVGPPSDRGLDDEQEMLRDENKLLEENDDLYDYLDEDIDDEDIDDKLGDNNGLILDQFKTRIREPEH